MTIPVEDDIVMLFDEFRNDIDYLKETGEDNYKPDDVRAKHKIHRQYNILATFEIVFMVGWKFHESQQKSKTPKSENFSLRDVGKFSGLVGFKFNF